MFESVRSPLFYLNIKSEIQGVKWLTVGALDFSKVRSQHLNPFLVYLAFYIALSGKKQIIITMTIRLSRSVSLSSERYY